MNVKIFEENTNKYKYPAVIVGEEYNAWKDANSHFIIKEIRTHTTEKSFVMVVIYEG